MDKDIVIRPPKGWFHVGLAEIWQYRELAYFFVWRDLKVRYKQTIVGFMWAIFQPLITMIVFTVLFGRLAKIPTENIPYPVFVYIGLLFWQYFSFGLSHAASSMVANASIIQKIYFPRLLVPISSALIGLVDFMISLSILFLLMLYYNYLPSLVGIILIPLLLFVVFLAAVGLGCFLAAINVKYRDVRYVLPFFINILMFITPVIYPVSLVDKRYAWLLSLNPMSGVIENARQVILGLKPIDWSSMTIALAISLVFFVTGVVYFRKTETYFADII